MGQLHKDGLGRKFYRNGLAWRDTACEDFSFLEFLFHLFFQAGEKIK
jgi:hypothetical protein